MKRFLSLFLIILLLVPACPIKAENEKKTEETDTMGITSEAAVLMEGSTGEILYEKNKDKQLIPASITKIMTLLLIFEALDSGKIKLGDKVTVSEHAASMGGSQVFLEPNETQTVNDMIKCISIASANDAAVAMGEKLAGSEPKFVELMNKRAAELGMKNTHFLNCTGLDDDITSGHYTSAYDVALMSRELITKHKAISKYSTVWMDTIHHTTKKGTTEFGLTNTNKMVRTYDGLTGLKTGYTPKAKHCLSATANRNGMDLIAVVMASKDFRVRFSESTALLDYGFANCTLYQEPANDFSYTFITELDKGDVRRTITYNENISAPIAKNDVLGEVTYFYKDKEIGKVSLLAKNDVEKASYGNCVAKMFHKFLLIP